MAVFRGIRTPGTGCVVTMDGLPLDPAHSLKLRNMSPTGFEWGYSGSGPAQLALAICDACMVQDLALSCFQDFKAEFVARWDSEGWEIEAVTVMQWVCGWLEQTRAGANYKVTLKRQN